MANCSGQNLIAWMTAPGLQLTGLINCEAGGIWPSCPRDGQRVADLVRFESAIREEVTDALGGPPDLSRSADSPDFTGTGVRVEVAKHSVPPGQPLGHHFPDAFGAHSLHLIAEKNSTTTATVVYE